MKKLIAAAIAAAVVAPAAQAGTEFYGNLGYSLIDGDDATLSSASVKAGAFFTENLGIEAEANVGTSSEEVLGVDIELEELFTLAGIAKYPINEKADLFARFGYATGSMKGSLNGFSASVDTDGFVFGVGGQYFFTDNIGVRAEYTGFEAKIDGESTDGNLDFFTVSLVAKFGTK